MLATRDLEKKAEEVAQLMGIISNARACSSFASFRRG